jgi:hypothetical protein
MAFQKSSTYLDQKHKDPYYVVETIHKMWTIFYGTISSSIENFFDVTYDRRKTCNVWDEKEDYYTKKQRNVQIILGLSKLL